MGNCMAQNPQVFCQEQTEKKHPWCAFFYMDPSVVIFVHLSCIISNCESISISLYFFQTGHNVAKPFV